MTFSNKEIKDLIQGLVKLTSIHTTESMPEVISLWFTQFEIISRKEKQHHNVTLGSNL